MTAVKGSPKEKRLASQFIARFFKHFPKLADQAIDAHLDLCEDEDMAVSIGENKLAEKCLFKEKNKLWVYAVKKCLVWSVCREF